MLSYSSISKCTFEFVDILADTGTTDSDTITQVDFKAIRRLGKEIPVMIVKKNDSFGTPNIHLQVCSPNMFLNRSLTNQIDKVGEAPFRLSPEKEKVCRNGNTLFSHDNSQQEARHSVVYCTGLIILQK